MKTTNITSQTMTADEVECYRRVLEHKVAEVRYRLSMTHAAEIVQYPEAPLDFGDWCQKSYEEWLFLNKNRLEVALLRELKEALRRLEAGAFGICPECGQPISTKRLAAVPWAKFCVPCQERLALLPTES